MLDFVINGDKYEPELNPKDAYDLLLVRRGELLHSYGLNKIYLPRAICIEIEALFPTLDRFLDTFSKGIMIANSIDSAHFNGKEVKVLSVFEVNSYDAVVNEFLTVQKTLEEIFRKANEIHN